MNLPESVENLPTNGSHGRSYGDPYRTADGATVIPVAKVRAGTATPLGVFVVHRDTARWVPVMNSDRLALIGVVTGLLSAVIASVALVRRPPWPDLSATSAAWSRP